ncbi:uncharacterized protein LOC128275002 [Anopheles cruzii]|uniref:uncharacterized protein LOC128275002 n=1 Tax=Anopheles cruzii TaxID=68878 RepID=UPI0022EC8629|nr:uncharacterized protein LOC128275002 [Anopheles cruzii]
MSRRTERIEKNVELASLVKERKQLRIVESTLQSMLEKINQQLNQLLVEELQLKSRDAQLTMSAENRKPSDPQAGCSSSNPTDVNKQVLNLGVEKMICFELLEESEEDEL